MRSYSHMSLPENNEKLFIRPSLKRRRLLVLALYFSFFTCLLALWLTSPLASNVGKFLPYWLIQAVIDNRLTILAIPLVCLFTCYISLRHITGDIIGGPERYLDERQKMILDQAHRYAYRIIKLACLCRWAFSCIACPGPVTHLPLRLNPGKLCSGSLTQTASQHRWQSSKRQAISQYLLTSSMLQ